MKKIAAVLFVLVFVLCSCKSDLPAGGIESFDDYNRELSEEEIAAAMKGAGNEIENRPDENICYVTINCETAVKSGSLSETMQKLIPSDGVILDSYEVRYEDGASAFDIIAAAVKDNGIHMEYKGGKNLPYIEGVANLYEFDCGDCTSDDCENCPVAAEFAAEDIQPDDQANAKEEADGEE